MNISAEKKLRVNQQIHVREVRLIGAEGEQLGIVAIDDARKTAEEAGMDLVEISPNGVPPVCRVMDYGKHVFQLNKKKHAAKKKQKQMQVKEMKYRPTIEDGDYQVKLRKLIEFLDNGDKIKVTIRFRGREMMHSKRGFELLERLEKDLDEYGVVEQRPKFEGRQVVMIMASKKKA